MLCAKFSWLHVAQGLWRSFFKIAIMYFAIFVIWSPWKRARPFFWIYFTQGFVLSLVKIGPVVLEKREISSIYFDSCYYLLLEKGVILHLNKHKSPSPTDASHQVWLKLAQWFWEEENVKIYDNDDDGQRTNCDKKCSLELSAQVSLKAQRQCLVVYKAFRCSQCRYKIWRVSQHISNW